MSSSEKLKNAPGPRGGKRLALLLLSGKRKHVGGKAEDADEDIDHGIPVLPQGSPLKTIGRHSPNKRESPDAPKIKMPTKNKDPPVENLLQRSIRENKKAIDPRYHEVYIETNERGSHKGTFADSNFVAKSDKIIVPKKTINV